MRVLSNVLTIELNEKEIEALETTIKLLSELGREIPSGSDYEYNIEDVTDFLHGLRYNGLSEIDVRFSWSNK